MNLINLYNCEIERDKEKAVKMLDKLTVEFQNVFQLVAQMNRRDSINPIYEEFNIYQWYLDMHNEFNVEMYEKLQDIFCEFPKRFDLRSDIRNLLSNIRRLLETNSIYQFVSYETDSYGDISDDQEEILYERARGAERDIMELFNNICRILDIFKEEE